MARPAVLGVAAILLVACGSAGPGLITSPSPAPQMVDYCRDLRSVVALLQAQKDGALPSKENLAQLGANLGRDADEWRAAGDGRWRGIHAVSVDLSEWAAGLDAGDASAIQTAQDDLDRDASLLPDCTA